MTSPRSAYGGGYYASPSFPDTPIYDSLVAERGTPQIAPIRVPSGYDAPGSQLSALPAALPALPSAPSPQPAAQAYGYGQQAQLQHAPAPYIPQQQSMQRGGHPGGGHPGAQPMPQPQRPMGGAGYEAMRPAAPRPAPAPMPYEDPYQRRHPGGY
ncbi:DUF6643 family protein [Streptomyces sp. KLOTTS4A1]|uniref:DUF6643 family protein n=1 Tax=Streptomyces sp. KLOTTS4A1 TaxID=3390996 RepID=UPI0039F483D3